MTASSAGLGHGSEFVLRLPLLDRQPSADPSGAAKQLAPKVTPRRVLIVDDNLDGADSLAIALGMRGHEVNTANDGTSALKLAQSWRPDVMLLDIGLPGMSGYEVARKLGQESWRDRLLLVALSGWTREADPQSESSAGFDAHLVKPADMRAVLDLIDKAPAPPL